MKASDLHDWQLNPYEARKLQQELATRIIRSGKLERVRFIAGVDVSIDQASNVARAAAVILSYPGLELATLATARGRLDFPYIPGLLSFREAPLAIEALHKLDITPDLMLVDGQGIAHPRRMGLACHLGLLTDIATIGCAKSRLCGYNKEPAEEVESLTELIDRDETIGVVLRTKGGCKPIYVSIGHRINLEDAANWVLACCRGYRLPQPVRMAHLVAVGHLEVGAPAV
jgi:deoxyribonuclease V